MPSPFDFSSMLASRMPKTTPGQNMFSKTPSPRPYSKAPAAPAPAQPSPSMPAANSWANQTNTQAGALSSPLSATSTAFNNATGQQDPPHIITTDNGRKFNTQTKTFLDGRPGGFAR